MKRSRDPDNRYTVKKVFAFPMRLADTVRLLCAMYDVHYRAKVRRGFFVVIAEDRRSALKLRRKQYILLE